MLYISRIEFEEVNILAFCMTSICVDIDKLATLIIDFTDLDTGYTMSCSGKQLKEVLQNNPNTLGYSYYHKDGTYCYVTCGVYSKEQLSVIKEMKFEVDKDVSIKETVDFERVASMGILYMQSYSPYYSIHSLKYFYESSPYFRYTCRGLGASLKHETGVEYLHLLYPNQGITTLNVPALLRIFYDVGDGYVTFKLDKNVILLHNSYNSLKITLNEKSKAGLSKLRLIMPKTCELAYKEK